MNETELLAVLDMNEDSPEQYGWLLSTIREHKACCPADLAFRLRDEIGKGRMFDDLNIKNKVYEYVIKSKGNKPIPELFLPWWICHSKPKHWIIAAFIAKDKKDE